MMKTINFESLYIHGELMTRTIMNYDRLETEEYFPPKVFRDGEYSWPGDWEGRTILGLVLLSQATHREPKYLKDIMSKIPNHLNDKGYFGKILPVGCVDEQQISGNSWFLRAMIEYYNWKQEEAVLVIIRNIVNNLLIPLKGFYSKYPIKPEQRSFEGDAIGSLTGDLVGNWYSSTDIGCAFIMLDGAIHAYQLLRLPELKELIDEMIAKFLEIDLLGISIQTHATLSALRGILRYYECSNDCALLVQAEKVFNIYIKEGMTENFSNYNWFGRPEWTEPCAVIDSFIVAVGLWRNTGNSKYLELAHNVFYNAMGYGQRPNGGFGCDTCAGALDEFLSPKEDLFEAFWCCTMRGGEGLARAVEYAYMIEGDEISVPFYNNSTLCLHFDDGDLMLNQYTRYPYKGYVRFEVISSTIKTEKKLKLFIPSWVDKNAIKLLSNNNQNIQIENNNLIIYLSPISNTRIELMFNISLRFEPVMNNNSLKGYVTYRHGDMLLGIENKGEAISFIEIEKFFSLGNGKYKLADTENILEPINNLMWKTLLLAQSDRRQIMFKI